MKKIMFLFLTVLTLIMFSCETQERIKNVTINPPQMMSMFKVIPAGSQITSTDTVSISVPNVADATIYYEIAVGDCKEPTTASTKFTGDFSLSTKNLSAKNGDMITLKILAEKEGYESATATKKWFYSDGSTPVLDNDAFLKSVTISDMSFSLLPGVFAYNDISVPNDVDKVTIGYEKSNYAATVETTPASLNDIPLTEKQTTLVALRVTSADKSTTKRYLFNIYRAGGDEPIKSTNCYLSSLSVDGAETAIIFDKNTTNYDVTLFGTTEKTKIVYQTEDSKATASIDDTADFSIAKGETVIRKIIVTAESGDRKEYTVSVYRPNPDNPVSSDATLKSLSVTGGDLTFNSATTVYDVTIPADYIGAVSVTYEKNHSGATVISNPVNLDNITVFPATVTINVTAEDKVTTKSYIVNINKTVGPVLSKNANLSGITLSAGSLTPAFNADTLKYSVSVENTISSVSVTATPEDAKATVIITPSGDTLLEENKAKDFTISVTAEDGTGKDYVVSVTRAGVVIPPPPPPPAGKYYWTNKDGAVGKSKTITIDGDASDWSEDMKIAQGAAWDVANHWKGGHENCVLDTVGLYAAWDDDNLYMGWQMVNTTDTWAREGDGPLSDGGRVLDVPLILALSVDSSSVKMSNKNATGGPIWGQKMGLEFSIHVDNLFYMSGKPGQGKPSLFKAVDSEGNTNYEEGCLGFKENNIVYKMAETNISSNIWGLNFSEDPSDVDNLDADWVDYKVFAGDSGAHKTKYDSFYEISIPFSVLGITKADLESKGIGAMLVATRGESALDCIPFDSAAMLDNATEDYGSDPSTSHEKDDIDNITVPLARVGKM